MIKMHWPLALCPGLRWRSLQRSPDSLTGLRRGMKGKGGKDEGKWRRGGKEVGRSKGGEWKKGKKTERGKVEGKQTDLPTCFSS